MTIDIRDNSVVIDGTELKFPMALAEVEEVLGQPDEQVQTSENELHYIYHEYGMVLKLE